MLRAAEKMGILDSKADRVPIERIARYFLEDFALTQTGNRQWTKDKSKEDQKAERAERRKVLGESLLRCAAGTLHPPQETPARSLQGYTNTGACTAQRRQ